jgi:hypothetical protein
VQRDIIHLKGGENTLITHDNTYILI